MLFMTLRFPKFSAPCIWSRFVSITPLWVIQPRGFRLDTAEACASFKIVFTKPQLYNSNREFARVKFMERRASVHRTTKETDIQLEIDLDGSGKVAVATQIPFFDHMLTLLAVHGFFDLSLTVHGDIEVDFHHTVEDVGLVLGRAFSEALGSRRGICRYGTGQVPMDEAFSKVNVDLSNRPFLIYKLPEPIRVSGPFDAYLAKEFFRAFSVQGGMNLHIHGEYGENEHHILESLFKATGRALQRACAMDPRITGVLSSKGDL